MAKRAIEEEFNRLYSEFIENPGALPRLKKRAKRCRRPSSNPQQEDVPASTVPVPVDICSLGMPGNLAADGADFNADEHPVRQRSVSLPPCPELVTHHDQDSAPHQRGTEHFAVQSDCCSEAGSGKDCQTALPSQPQTKPSSGEVTNDATTRLGYHASDGADVTTVKTPPGENDDSSAYNIFMLHKPKIYRVQSHSMQKCLNLDVLWAVCAKTWFVPASTVGSHHGPLVFLQRNLRLGKAFFKKYISQRKALDHLSKPPSSSCQEDLQSSKQLPPKDTTAQEEAVIKMTGAENTHSTSSTKQDKNKVKLKKEANRAQKRKEHKPKLHIGKRQQRAKTDQQNESLKKSQDVAGKTASLQSKKLSSKTKLNLQGDSGKGKHIQTHGQVSKKDSSVGETSLTTSSKPIWKKKETVERQVAVCRPNAKGKPNYEVANASGLKPAPDANAKCGLKTAVSTGEDKKSLAGVETQNFRFGEGFKPLFVGPSGHCGGVWKSVVEEC